MTIHLAADHAGYKLKEAIKKWLASNGYQVKDHGAFSYDKRDDYPDFMKPAAQAVARDPRARGIVVGGTGQGEAIISNRVKGVRAAVYYGFSPKVLKLSREHNNANILALAGFLLSEKEGLAAVELWLKTPFSQAVRHKRRLGKIDKQ